MKLLFSLLVFLNSACATSGAVVPEQSLELAEEQMQAVLDSGGPAVGLMIVQHDRQVFLSAKGKRTLQQEVTVTDQDVWHLGSDTKSMTAFLVALAIQDGKLTYETEITDVLKVARVHKDHKKVTVAQVLTQSSGIQDFGVPLEADKEFAKKLFGLPDLVEQRQKIIAATLKLPRLKDWKPGKFAYTNINYIIAGHLLEEIYQKPWEQLMMEQLFQPLGMNSCGFGVAGDPEEEVPSQPWPHFLNEGKLFGLAPKHKADNAPMLGPAGTVHCSLQDWGRFVTELIATHKGQGRFLKRADVVEKYFATNGAATDMYTHGGWGRLVSPKGTVAFQHSGSNTMNYATALFSPDKNTFVLMTTNAGHPPLEKAFREAMAKLGQEFVDDGK